MRNAKETAELVEQVAQLVFKERAYRQELGVDLSYPSIVYVACKKYDCLHLFEYILEIITNK